jgi:hypothetical protein
MNRRTASLCLVALSTFASHAAANDVSATVSPAGKTIGVGIEVGAPTTVNAKFMVASNQGVVVGIGGGAWYDASLSLHGDYLFHPLVAQFDGGAFSAYIGGGVWTSLGFGGNHYGYWAPYYRDHNPFGIGVRMPLGLTLAFNEVPVEVFGEVVPALSVFPGFGVFGQGGLGARFYF